MTSFFTIAKIDLGDAELLITSDSAITLFKDSDSLEQMRFSTPCLGVSVPARSVDMVGRSASAGSASISLSTEIFDAIDYIASGGSIVGKEVEVRLVYDSEFYEDSYLGYRGVITSFKLDVDEGKVDLDIGPDFVSVDKSFPESKVGDEGRFPDAPEGTKSRAIPVIYGHVKKVPVPIVGFFGESARIAIASHHVYGSDEKRGFVKIGTTPKGDLKEHYEIQFRTDSLGQPYSYIDIPKDLWDDSIYLVELHGKTSSNGRAISRLGDTIQDLWLSYAGGSLRNFDAARVSKSTPLLNSIRVGLAITESVVGQSVIDIVAGRLQNMPVRLCYDRGLFAWESVFWPRVGSGSKPFTFGLDSVQRSSLEITPLDQIRNRFRFKMSFDAKFNETSETRMVDQSNSQSLMNSVSLFGETSIEEVDLSDATDKLGAGIAIDNIIRTRSNPRITITYSGCDSEFLNEALGGCWSITDESCGLNSAEFVLVSVAPEVQSGSVSLTFLSVEDVNTTLRKSRESALALVVSSISSESQSENNQSESENNQGEEQGQAQDPDRYGVYLQILQGSNDTAASIFTSASYVGIRTSEMNSGDLSEREGYEIILVNNANPWQVLVSHPTQTAAYGTEQYLSASRIPFEYTYMNIVKGRKEDVFTNMQVYPLDENFSRINGARFAVRGYMRLGELPVAIMNHNIKPDSDLISDKIGYAYLSISKSSVPMRPDPRTVDGVENQIRHFEYGHNIIWRNHPGLWPRGKLTGHHLAAFGNYNVGFDVTEDRLSDRLMLTTDITYFQDTYPGDGDNSRTFMRLSDEDIWKNDWYGESWSSFSEEARRQRYNRGDGLANGSNIGTQIAHPDVSGSTASGPSSFDTMSVIGFITPKILRRLGISEVILKGQAPLPTMKVSLVVLKFEESTFVHDQFNPSQNWNSIGAPFAVNSKKFIIQGGDTDKPYFVIGKREDASSTSERWWLFVTKIGHDTELDTSESMVISNNTRANQHTITPYSSLSGYHACALDTEFTFNIYDAIVEGTTELTDSNGKKWLVQQKHSTTSHSNSQMNHVFITPVNHSDEPGNFNWT